MKNPFLLFLSLITASACARSNPNEDFWAWFIQKQDAYYQLNSNNRDKLFADLTHEMRKVHENLTFEFSPVSPDGTREFVISADGIKTAFPAVKALVASAPRMPKWRVIAFRQPHPGLIIQYNEVTIEPSKVLCSVHQTGGKLDIVLYIPRFAPEDSYRTAAYLVLDSELGEYAVESYIGEIDLQPLPPVADEHWIRLPQLKAKVDSLQN